MNGAQIHLVLNHLPVLGVAFASALTLAGVVRGSDELKKAGLWAFVIAGLTALPAYFTGEGAEDVVERLPDVTKALIHEHEEAAEKALAGALILGGAALAALAHAFKTKSLLPKAPHALVALSLPVLAVLGWAAHLGGLVRHTELRPAGVAAAPAAGEEADKD